MPSLNSSLRDGVRLVAAFGPQFNFDYSNKEPSAAALAGSSIQGAITGVPKMGPGMWLGYVGEEMDASQFGATSGATNWGDGSGEGAESFTHTYDAPGVFWATNGSPAKAARVVRVLHRTRPTGDDPVSPFDVSYPVIIDGTSDGAIDGTFSIKFRISFATRDFADSALGYIPDRAIVGIFAQEFRGGVEYGNPTLVAGGFVTQRGKVGQAGGKQIYFTAYGPNYWLNLSDMRMQYYIDPGIAGMDMAQDVFQSTEAGSATQAYNKYLGYNPSHLIKCQPTICALHIIQHVRVYASDLSGGGADPAYPANPAMQSTQGANFYGTLGQFMDINTGEDNINEGAGRTEAGYHSFSVTDGKVLSNIRSLIDSEGFRYFDCSNLTQEFARKPFYRGVQPDPAITLTDLSLLPGKYEILGGTERLIAQIQVEKPVLGTLSDATYTGDEDFSPRDPNGMVHSMEYPPFSASGDLERVYGIYVFPRDNGQLPLGNASHDDLTASTNYDDFIYKYPNPARPTGAYIGPLRGIFSLDPAAYAMGRDKEERARWTLKLPLGQVPGVEIGSIIAVTHTDANLGVDWTAKLFDIGSKHSELKAGRLFVSVEALEVDPDDQPAASGTPSSDDIPEETGFAPASAPEELAATAGDAQVQLTWEAVDGATRYSLKRSTSSGGPYTVIAGSLTTTDYLDGSLTNGQIYYYKVAAGNSSGLSVYSAEVSAIPSDGSTGTVRVKRRTKGYYLSAELYPDAFVWDAELIFKDVGEPLENTGSVTEQLWPEPNPVPCRVEFYVRSWPHTPYDISNPDTLIQFFFKEVTLPYTLQTDYDYIVPDVAVGGEFFYSGPCA